MDARAGWTTKTVGQLKAQAPRYAKLLPDLPRLLNDYLKKETGQQRLALVELLAEQRRTNRLLQAIIYGGIGFALGLIAMQIIVKVRLW